MTLDDTQLTHQPHFPEVENQQPISQIPNFTLIEHQLENPQFPKTLTLDPQIPPGQNNPPAIGEDLVEPVEEPEPRLGMSLSSPFRPVTDAHVAVKAISSRRGGQKRKRVNKKQLAAMQLKVQILTGNLNLIPFVPNRALDFASHENLLRRLGLWDFVHVELDSSNLRVDLIAQLIANYKRTGSGRVSEVNGVRIKISRADFGRALKLPPVTKESNSGVITIMDEDAEFVSEGSVRFVEELMSNWMLLHDQDAWIMPAEVMRWIEMIRKGHPDKVEWASLMWFMAEKELSQGLHLVDCYYASHFQHLIKHQNERLFLMEHDEDVIVREEEEEDGGDVEMVDEETAVREACVDHKVTSTVSKETEAEAEAAVTAGGVDDKVTSTVSKETEAEAAVTAGGVDDMMFSTLSKECEASLSEGCVDDKMAFTFSKEAEAVVTEGGVDDMMPSTLSKDCEASLIGDCADDKMALKVNKESEASVSEGCVDDKMAYTLGKECKTAVSEGCVADKMTGTLTKECGAAVSECCVDDKMACTLSKDCEAAFSEGCVDDKKVCTLSKESEATVSVGCVDDKMLLKLSKKYVAVVSEDYVDAKMAFTVSKEYEAVVSKDYVDAKMAFVTPRNSQDVLTAFTVSKESEAEKISIDVNEVCTGEKIGDEVVGVKVSDLNNGTLLKELSTHTEINEGDDFQDLHDGCPEGKSEEPSVELTLGQDNFEKDNVQPDDVMNFEDLGLGDNVNWQFNENNGEREPILRQCSFDREKGSLDIDGRVEENIIDDDEMEDDVVEEEVGVDDDDVEEVDDDDDEVEEEAGVDGDINLDEKFDSLQGISSPHMFQDISQGAFGSPLSLLNDPHMQLFVSHAETSSTALGNTLKRAADHDQNLSNHRVTGENKRFRSDTWDHQEPSDFDQCMENIGHWMAKAKMMYAAKEQECTQMSMNQQLLYDEVAQRNHMMEHQERITNEVRMKSQMEIYKLEKELLVMGGLLDTYKKAMKEIRRDFAEYRKKCPLPEEPIYEDAGPGGLVLSVRELERQRILQEEEEKVKRLEFESTFKSFEAKWYPVFEGHMNSVQQLDEKLLLLEEKAKLLNVKGLPQNQKAEEIMEQPTMTED